MRISDWSSDVCSSDLVEYFRQIYWGSGICGMIAVRDVLGLRTEIVGVVASNAPAYALSFEAGRPVPTNRADTMADGLACRMPDAAALEAILHGAARIVTVSETEIAAAMRYDYTDTHNLAADAGAAQLGRATGGERECH